MSRVAGGTGRAAGGLLGENFAVQKEAVNARSSFRYARPAVAGKKPEGSSVFAGWNRPIRGDVFAETNPTDGSQRFSVDRNDSVSLYIIFFFFFFAVGGVLETSRSGVIDVGASRYEMINVRTGRRSDKFQLTFLRLPRYGTIVDVR